MEGTEREKKNKEQAYNFGISGISKRECEKIVAFFHFLPSIPFRYQKIVTTNETSATKGLL